MIIALYQGRLYTTDLIDRVSARQSVRDQRNDQTIPDEDIILLINLSYKTLEQLFRR